MTAEPSYFPMPVAGLTPVDMDYANSLLTRWKHELGPSDRPFGQMAWVLDVQGAPVSVAVSASTVSSTVSGWWSDGEYVSWRRGEVVELARQCSDPAANWATRPMLRLWREVAAPAWAGRYWPVRAAVSYSLGSKTGAMYKLDGWTKIRDNCGSSGGGTWTKKRNRGQAVGDQKKSLWVWRYDRAKSGES